MVTAPVAKLYVPAGQLLGLDTLHDETSGQKFPAGHGMQRPSLAEYSRPVPAKQTGASNRCNVPSTPEAMNGNDGWKVRQATLPLRAVRTGTVEACPVTLVVVTWTVPSSQPVAMNVEPPEPLTSTEAIVLP
jgi:hypothetical protein